MPSLSAAREELLFETLDPVFHVLVITLVFPTPQTGTQKSAYYTYIVKLDAVGRMVPN